MRVMVMLKSSENSEAGLMPNEERSTEMSQFNEELVKAGVRLAAEGLQPSSQGKRVRFEGGKAKVIDGPFTEAKELIAGFWLWQVRDMDEAVEWVKRIPNPEAHTGEIEIRRVYELEDLGDEFTPAARAQEERLRQQLESDPNR